MGLSLSRSSTHIVSSVDNMPCKTQMKGWMVNQAICPRWQTVTHLSLLVSELVNTRWSPAFFSSHHCIFSILFSMGDQIICVCQNIQNYVLTTSSDLASFYSRCRCMQTDQNPNPPNSFMVVSVPKVPLIVFQDLDLQLRAFSTGINFKGIFFRN